MYANVEKKNKIKYAKFLCKNWTREGVSNNLKENKSFILESSGKKFSSISGQELYIWPASNPETSAPKEICKITKSIKKCIRKYWIILFFTGRLILLYDKQFQKRRI